MTPRFFAAAALGLLAFPAPLLRAQQLLQSDPAAVDFGRRAENQSFTARVRLTNATANPITILSVQSDCGCLTGEEAIPQLAPGESTMLTARMESGGAEGDFEHTLVVNSSAGPAVSIPVRMTVFHYADWVLSPPRVLLPPSRRGAEAVGELSLHYLGDAPPRISSIASDSPWIEIAPSATAGNAISYVVRKRPGAPGGAVYANIRIDTGDSASPSLDVPVFAYITSNAAVDPNPIVMPAVAEGATAVATAKLKNWDGAGAPRPDLTGGTARIKSRHGRDFVLELTLIDAPAGSSTHTLSIYDGSQAVLAVPVIERTAP
jgi:hypothetical protein